MCARTWRRDKALARGAAKNCACQDNGIQRWSGRDGLHQAVGLDPARRTAGREQEDAAAADQICSDGRDVGLAVKFIQQNARTFDSSIFLNQYMPTGNTSLR